MKKFLSVCLLTALLVLALPLQAFAAGSASFSGPSVVRAGDTITLTFKAGGGIYGGNGTISYDGSQLTLQGYSGKLGSPWAVEFAGDKFVFYDNSMAQPLSSSTAIFTATFRVNDGVAPGTTISVSATGVTLSDGTSDTSVGTKTYSVTVAEPLSGNCDLSGLTVENAEISPAFSADNTSYKASVPFSTSSLKISATAAHGGAKVEVTNNKLVANGTTKVKITVTAENGATKTYTISTQRAKDPNYKESTVNTLASLSVEGFLLSPAFNSERQDYAIYVPYETETVTVLAEVTDSKSKVAIPAIENIPLGETTYTIPVTAENGDVRNYTVTVFRAQPFDDTIVVPEPTVPETTVPETTVPETTVPETTVAPTTVPETTAPAPTEPAPEEANRSVEFWFWLATCSLCFAAGALLTVIVTMLRKKK